VDPQGGWVKRCSFDCLYRSLGPREEKTVERRVSVFPERVERELREALREVEAEVITFCGLGEPTLASNLGELIGAVRRVSLPVAVLTNSSLMESTEVRKELTLADVVKGKLDAEAEERFVEINRPHSSLQWRKVVEGWGSSGGNSEGRTRFR